MNLKTIKNEILGGEILTRDFIAKQFKLVLLIIFLLVFYINNRYVCLQKISEINKLKRELKDAKFESLTRTTELMSRSKQSQIEKMINDRGVYLESPKSPPYVMD